MRPRTALAILLGLTVVHLWPLAAAPWRLSLNHHADAQLNTWTLAWIDHALVTDPVHLFDGNVFAPERHTLTYSDPLIVPALIGAPIRLLGGSPVLEFNLVTIAGLTLTAFSGWLVVRRWTGSASAALVSGALVAFNVHLLTRLAHVAASHLWGVPLAIYWTDRMIERPAVRTGVALAAVVAATAATSLYRSRSSDLSSHAHPRLRSCLAGREPSCRWQSPRSQACSRRRRCSCPTWSSRPRARRGRSRSSRSSQRRREGIS